MSTDIEDLVALARALGPDALAQAVDALPPAVAAALLEDLPLTAYTPPRTLAQHAQALYPDLVMREHTAYVADRIDAAFADLDAGLNRRLIVQMPPRSGKTTLATIATGAHALAHHPTWPIALTSHDGDLATSWGRTIRRWAEAGALGPAVAIPRDATAAGAWETTSGGKMLSISVRESFTGRGAKVLVIDDPHKDFVDAHSEKLRGNVWDWWLSVAQTRLEPPYLVIVVATRWHEDDLIGRLLSEDHEGDPRDWEVIALPAVADSPADPLGRAPGQPLRSPLISETHEQALARWAEVRRSVGEYVWAAMYQQHPAPAKGAIFDSGWWRFWTTNPARADGERVIYLDPLTDLSSARWLDSWDAAFKAAADTDYVVGQRWALRGIDRFLVDQCRDRWTFTQTLERMSAWASPTSAGGTGRFVHQRLIEDKANGPAIIDTLKNKIAGLKPITPAVGKEGRARAVTPEIESGHVWLPHPSDPGHEWVNDLLSELREFPHGSHDDSVDSMTQALLELRENGHGQISSPASQRIARPLPSLTRSTPASRRPASSAAALVRIPGR